MNIDKTLLNRLVCAKYIYLRGIDVINNDDYFSSGLAVLHFQDAVEMVLRVIGENEECKFAKVESFIQLIEKIEMKSERVIPNRSSIIRLNDVRVNFKHKGIMPNEDFVKEFSVELESFFTSIFQIFLSVDFNSISLASLINHRRTKNFLEKSDMFITKEDYKMAVENSAIAFYIFQKHNYSKNNIHERYRRNLYSLFKDYNIREWADMIEKNIDEQKSQLNIIMNGINLSDYNKFKRYAPYVLVSDLGPITQIYNPDYRINIEPSKKIALFCQRFVIDAILSMIKNRVPPEFPVQISHTCKYKVIKNCNILVYPDSSEIIRHVDVGEVLNGVIKTLNKTSLASLFQDEVKIDYLEIDQDSDIAYIKKDSVKIFDDETV